MTRVHIAVTCSLAAVTLLVAVQPAVAHLAAEPNFLPVGGKQRIALTVHNDRDETMTAFRLTAPAGIRILGTGGGSGWNEFVEGETARWSGGNLAPDTPVVFEVDIEAVTTEPGTVELEGDQLYPGGESVTWEVSLTVVPPGTHVFETEEQGIDLFVVGVLVAVAALALAAIAFLLWRRRRETLTP